MKFSIHYKYYNVFRYIFTVILALAFFTHFYFLTLAKNNISEYSKNNSVLYIEKINSESDKKTLTKEQILARSANKKASEVYLQLEQAEAIKKGELTPFFYQSLELMSVGNYNQAMSILLIIEQDLESL